MELMVDLVLKWSDLEKIGMPFKDMFRGKIKLLAFSHAIEDHGKGPSINQGFDVLDQNSTYAEAMQF